MRRLGLIIATSLLAASTICPPGTRAGSEGGRGSEIVAYVDGRQIPLTDVSKYYCDDFSFPTISCSANRLATEARATATSLLASVAYVTIYELAYYAGSYMNVSQDYSILALIGWNDKISSFKVRNIETGRFWTDWFYSGSMWSFCCDSQVSTLGAYDNTFSSVLRT